jgi:hypothetical protein
LTHHLRSRLFKWGVEDLLVQFGDLAQLTLKPCARHPFRNVLQERERIDKVSPWNVGQTESFDEALDGLNERIILPDVIESVRGTHNGCSEKPSQKVGIMVNGRE